MTTPLPVHPDPRRGPRRTVLAVLILAAWATGVGLLVRREFFREQAAILAEAALRLGPSTSFFVVEQSGRQIGYASTTIDTSSAQFEVTDFFTADLPVGGRDFRASARSVITLSRGLALRTFDVAVESAVAPLRVTGRAEGDSAVVYRMEMPGQPADSQRLAVRGPILLPTLIPAAAVLVQPPEVGGTVTIASFDPATMAAKDLTLRIAAESLFSLVDSARFDSTAMRFVPALIDTVRAWQLVPTEGQGFSGWVDAQGRVVEATQPGGITLKRIAYEIAFENWRRAQIAAGTNTAATRGTSGGAGTLGDLLEGTAVAAGALPGVDGPDRLRVRLTGTSLDGFDLQGGRQRRAGDEVTIVREDAAALTADWSLASRTPGFRQRFAAELASEPLLQANDPAIVALAVRIAGTARDPQEVARRLNRWVHDSLAKEITISVPNALQVLRTRRGDCNEHTQLFAALARAVGIPTRIATGLAYVNGKFYYHAWPEVRLRDWVAVDPTFGQFPADAAHLRFVRGGLTRQGELLRLVGTLRVEVLDAR
ncbi:MAG: transglutaminase-like domain-containing protein [Gemmatimonadaceae bacterium]|nr:transglutaminase-like domain-containing protein [Gemmatimonadaceae bacterium]